MNDSFPPASKPSPGIESILDAIVKQRRRQDWNDRFTHWEKPASVTEEGTISRAQANVKAAIGNNTWLSTEGVTIFPQGSYHNNTNVRAEADIDLRAQHPIINVLFAEGVIPEYAYSAGGYSDYGMTFDQAFRQLRAELVADLAAKFGWKNLDIGKKAIRIRGITGSRAEVDVVPAARFHWVTWNGGLGQYNTLEGICILSSNGQWTFNFPEQHHENGVAKRGQTALRFKRVVRVFKRLRADMEARGIANVKIPSFLVECLVYAVEDRYFLIEEDDRYDRVLRVALRIREMLSYPDFASKMTEINEVKTLFHSNQAWTYPQALAFARAVVAYLGDA
ncbi:MAG: hypothetical protein ISP41_12840 [Alphaproteobacteria bacterium]|nr:hypothetical protein [Alphaproteobacteria bacterium]